jgi:hypothetical protein
MSETIKSTWKKDFQELASEAVEWAAYHLLELLKLIAGALVVAFGVVVAVNLVVGIIAGVRLDPGDIIRIAIVIVAFVVGLRIMQESDYIARLFRRW